MSVINVSGLTFGYDGSFDLIFDNVSFRIDTDWKLGFTGRNGRGKTTFLRLLMGEMEYRGTISAPVHFDYFPFSVGDGMSMNAWEIAAGLNPGFECWALEREARLLGLEPELMERPFQTLSYGERTKLLLAMMFTRENNFLLIDEPTNHLDAEARRVICRYLNSKSGFILVSHDRGFLDGCVDHILSINKTNIEIQQGNFSSWYANKELQDRYEIERNEKLRKEVKRLDAATRRTKLWSDSVEATKIGNGACDRGYIGHMAAKMMKRSKNTERRRESAAEEKRGLLKNIEVADELKLSPLEYHKKVFIECRELSVNYGDNTVFKDLSFTLERGDRLALSGRNGCGKTSVIKLLLGLGKDIGHTGSLIIGTGLEISYVSQDTSWLCGSLNEFIRERQLDESLFKAVLAKLDFSKNQFEKLIEDYSEGQKKKLLLAGSLCSRAHLYVWDEPLNYVDVISRIQIEELILKNAPTMIFVEHDAVFCDKIATKQVVFE